MKKMKKYRQHGFVLILVIVAIIIMGIEMFALSDIANAMQFESNAAYLKASRRNLQASGLVWAKENIRIKNGEIFDKTIQLDVSQMKIRESALNVTIHRISDSQAEVQVDTSCRRGRQIQKGTSKYGIKYVQTNKVGMVRQREVGKDTRNYDRKQTPSI